MTITDSFAARLKALREERNLSQSQLADALGVSRGSISFYENGERTPDIAFLAQVKEYFRVRLDYLLGYTDEKYSNPVIEINTFTSLPQYAQSRIERVKDCMAEAASKYIPAVGGDPNKLFDFLYSDVLSVIEAYNNLPDGIYKSYATRYEALERFKADLDRSSVVDVIRHLVEQSFEVKNQLTVLPKAYIPEGPPKKKGWKKK